MPMILFVCTGNICRSPMAEVLLRARLDRDEARRDWRVKSAGTEMAGGRLASAYAIDEMAERGIDLRAHRARRISRELMEEADLVLQPFRPASAFDEYFHCGLEGLSPSAHCRGYQAAHDGAVCQRSGTQIPTGS